MKSIFKNWGYFVREAKTMIGLSLTLNMVSLLSTGLIFFIFTLVIAGWQVSNEVIEAIEGEAEISVYFTEALSRIEVEALLGAIEGINGVGMAGLVEQEEAHRQMETILGQEAQVLSYFEESPFQAFIEVRIDLEQIDSILEKINELDQVESVRDNREVLDRIQQLAGIFKSLGYVILSAVGIATLVIISHMIRLGIYHNREHIYTLRLLGAPEYFIGLPYLIEGLLLTLGGGILAAGLGSVLIRVAYRQMMGPLPFIPLPPLQPLIFQVTVIILLLSGGLGLAGSLIGLQSAKEK